MSIRLRYDRVDKYLIQARLESPMHVGAGESSGQDILLHPTTRRPFIQASSLTGALRDYYDNNFGQAEILFGGCDDENEHALIKISDGIFSDQYGQFIEFRPRVRINPESGTVSESKVKGTDSVSGHKFDMEYIGAGAEFEFSVYVYRDQNSDPGIEEHLLNAFAALNNGEIVLGGQKSNGCGDATVKHLYHRAFQLKDPADRTDWMKEDELKYSDYKDLVEELSRVAGSVYRLKVFGEIESAALVKGYQVDSFGQGAPDAVNIRNSKGDYIIPGSSLKGTIRSRVSFIADTLGLDAQCVNEVFGSLAVEGNGVPGNARFYDTVIGSKDKNNKNSISHRIHIDKFTSGVMYKALFSEKTAFGSIDCIKIDVSGRHNPERSVGLLILALRDLANGFYNLGGGYHIGRGFVNMDRIEIEHGNRKAIISFRNDSITDSDRLIDQCLEAVKKGA